jgi:hypothetical protein
MNGDLVEASDAVLVSLKPAIEKVIEWVFVHPIHIGLVFVLGALAVTWYRTNKNVGSSGGNDPNPGFFEKENFKYQNNHKKW